MAISRPHPSLIYNPCRIFNPCRVNPCNCDDQNIEQESCGRIRKMKKSISYQVYQVKNIQYKLYSWLRPIRNTNHSKRPDVCLVEDTRNKRQYVVKKYRDMCETLANDQRILREIMLMRHMDHPNIMGLVGCIVPERLDNFYEIYLVMDRSDTTYINISMPSLSMTVHDLPHVLA